MKQLLVLLTLALSLTISGCKANDQGYFIEGHGVDPEATVELDSNVTFANSGMVCPDCGDIVYMNKLVDGEVKATFCMHEDCSKYDATLEEEYKSFIINNYK